MIDLSLIKRHFPIFNSYPDLIFVDNASTTQKPSSVIDSISNYYYTSNANIHRAVYELGIKSDEIYENVRKHVCEFYQKEICVFTNGTTDGFNKIARALEEDVKLGDNIVLTQMEHHSNLVPWQELCKRTGAELRLAEMTDKGDLDYDHLETLIDSKTKVISVVHISNTLGTVNDLGLVKKLIGDHECIFIVDAAQSCALYQKQIQEIDADAFVFGAHKMFGPSGLGVIMGKRSFFDKLAPFNYGGGMVTEVEAQHSEYRDDLSRFEGGTPPLAQVAGLEAALKFLEDLDLGQCLNHVSDLGMSMRGAFSSLSTEVMGNPQKATGILSVDFDGIHPHDVASYLNSANIAVRAGHHCTQLIMKRFNKQSSVRFSFSIYNSEDEISKIVDAVRSMQKFFL